MLAAALAALLAAPLVATGFDAALELHLAGRAREALAAYRAVIAAPATPPEELAAAHNNACVLEGELGEHRVAVESCTAALRLRRELGDVAAVAESANNLALALELVGRTEEAARLYEEALELNRRLGDVESEAVNLGNLGALALAAGRYGRAMELYQRAADLAAGASGEPWAQDQLRAARINRGVVLEKVGAYREAVALYRELLAVDEGGDPRQRAALLVNAGVIYRNLDDAVSALAAFDEAITLYRHAEDPSGLSNALLNRGLALQLNLARPRAAEEAFRQALALAERSGDRTEEVQDLFYLGRLLLAQGRLAEAEEAFRRTLRVAVASGSAEGRWSAREGLGRIAVARGDPLASLDELQAALGEIEAVRSGLGDEAWRSGFFGDKRGAYAVTVAALAQLAEAEPGGPYAARAFHVAQRAKARDLLDALDARLATVAPRTAAEVVARLGDDTLLEYHLGEERLFLWVLRGSRLRLHDLGLAAPVLAAVERVHRSLAASDAPAPGDLDLLSRTLLPAAVEPLPRGAAELRIAPDGVLRYLPFELLTSALAAGLLADRTTVSYLPSGSLLGVAPPARPVRGALRVAGLAPGPGAQRDTATGSSRPLAAAERELRTVAALLGGRSMLFTGSGATEAAFRSAWQQRPAVLHFAAHAVAVEGPGGGAAVELSATGGEDDGRLTPREVVAAEGHARLVVLAACRTALPPRGVEGRALASLTGSFLASGTPAVVATLWDVEDATTAVVMEQLYSQLRRGVPPAVALRRVKARLRADPRWSHPSRWAAYVLVGNGVPVAPRPRAPLLAGALAVAAAALLAWDWRRRRASSRRPG